MYLQHCSLEKLLGGGFYGELRRILQDDNKVDVNEVKYDCVVWIHLTQARERWQAHREFLTICTTISIQNCIQETGMEKILFKRSTRVLEDNIKIDLTEENYVEWI